MSERRIEHFLRLIFPNLWKCQTCSRLAFKTAITKNEAKRQKSSFIPSIIFVGYIFSWFQYDKARGNKEVINYNWDIYIKK